MQLLIAGGRVIDPAGKTDGVLDVLVRDGKIAQIGRNLTAGGSDTRRIDARGLVVAPGLVDMHVHLRDPGQEYKEDIASGTRAAARGGVTSVACMPNTLPTADNPDTIAYIRDKAQKVGRVNVFPIGAVSKGQSGGELVDFAALKAAGAVALSDDGHPVESAALMRRAMYAACRSGLKIISHCEEMTLAAGAVNEGEAAKKLGLPGIPNEAEEIMVAREIVIAANTGVGIHIAHISTAGSAALIRDAKARGVPVTCETCPHYLLLTQEALFTQGTNAKMNPPLRTEKDRQALLRAVADGTVDAIATDHAPHHKDEKSKPFVQAPNGVIGLETLLPASLSALHASGLMSLSGLLARLSCIPASILGIDKGRLTPGADADIVIFDPERERTVKADEFISKAQNSPFIGMRLRGAVKYTIVGGVPVFEE